MNDVLLLTIASLSAISAAAAVILYFVAQKFKVIEDPRIDEVEAILPAANCGGCGFAGCRNFSEALVKSDTGEGLFCPVGGNDIMMQAAKILGREASIKDPLVAVIRCAGSFAVRHKTSIYDGVSNCAVESALYQGDTGCQYGCLMQGDCVVSCQFGALYLDEQTGLPVVIDEKCTACGACVKACPKTIIELRKRFPKDRKIFVSCINQDKGPVARKSCTVACIGCGKCVKVCPHDAITMANNLAYIDHLKCKLCRKCVAECPTGAIWEVNFPLRKIQPEVNKINDSVE